MRTATLVIVFIVLAAWESLYTKRLFQYSRPKRWTVNLGFALINNVLLRVAIPISLIQVAEKIEMLEWGLNPLLGFSGWAATAVSVTGLDLLIYFQHRAFHYFGPLWRLHRVHHADPELDLTTGTRFHPAEILLSFLIKSFGVLLLGVSAKAITIFELTLTVSSLFNHANIKIPTKLDELLRGIVVTPDMHRTHHSTLKNEMNSCFAFCISLWDRIFGTYCSQPKQGHLEMTIGVSNISPAKGTNFNWMMTSPFKSDRSPNTGRNI